MANDILDRNDLPNGAQGYPAITSGVVDLFEVDIDDKVNMTAELSISDVYIYESLLSPMPTMTVKLTDTTHLIKNLYYWKMKGNQPPNVKIHILNPYIDGKKGILIDNLKIYRLDERKSVNYHTETFNLHMIHNTAFNNMTARMSEYYKKVELSKVIDDAMTSLGVSSASEVEKTEIIRNYMSNNQHPFQVISEIADMAMNGSRVPYLHYMTFENVVGKHYFKSLNALCVKNKVVGTYKYNEKGAQRQLIDPYNIMSYEFPCDFDTLLDLSSGILHNKDLYKDHKPSMVSINPFDSEVYLVDGKSHGARKTQGFGGVLNTGAWSNINLFEASKGGNGGQQGPGGQQQQGEIGQGIADQPSQVEKYLHRRTEILSFLHRERVDLKITIPFTPERHVGDKINVEFYSKRDGDGTRKDFGSGEYLVVHMTHNIKVGSYGTSTLECIRLKDTHVGPADPRYSHQRLFDLLNIQNDRGR